MTDEQYPVTDTSEFVDPLENYEPPEYDDPLEQTLAEQRVAAIQAEPYSTVNSTTSIDDVLRKLSGEDIACVMVVEEDQLVGLFSDRDVLENVAERFTEIKNQPVSEVMTEDPIFVYDTDSAAAALSVMAVSGYRHVPVLDQSEKIVGIISPQRVTSFLQKHFEENS